MSTWSTPKTDHAPGGVPTAAQLNTLGDDLIVVGTGNLLSVALASDYTLTGSFADVTGMTLTLNKIGDWLIFGVGSALLDATATVAGGVCQFRLDVAGTPKTALGYAPYLAYNQNGFQMWSVNVPSGTKVIKMQAYLTAGVNASKLKQDHTQLFAMHVNAA